MRIRITNERLWAIAQQGEDIDQWLKDVVGPYNYKEWFGLTALPYRSFEIYDEKLATMFMLRWG